MLGALDSSTVGLMHSLAFGKYSRTLMGHTAHTRQPPRALTKGPQPNVAGAH